MKSRRGFVCSALLASILFAQACDSQEQVWESSQRHGNCELRSRGSHKSGDILGRGKSYRFGETTLWHSGKQILGDIYSLEASQDDRWAFISTLDAQGRLAPELHIVDIQNGVIHRRVALPGLAFDRAWDPAGLRLAVGLPTTANVKTVQLDVFDTTDIDISQRTVFKGPGDSLQFPTYAWSPDSSSIAFVTTTRGQLDVSEFIHLNLAGGKAEVVNRVGCSGVGEVDWTDLERPVLR